MSDNTEEIQVKGRFKRGQSGNPGGKPKGTPSRGDRLVKKMFTSNSKDLKEIAVRGAKVVAVRASGLWRG